MTPPQQTPDAVAARIANARAWARIAAAWACVLLLIAVFAATATVARGGYQRVLQIAIVCDLLAGTLLGFALWRGGIIVRVVSALGLVPLLFVASEFFRRYQF